jgi:hypothetical protein
MAGKIIADTIEASGSQISLNVGNVTVLTASSTGLTLIPTTNVNINLTNSIVNLTSGNVTNPSLTFSGNTSTGIYLPTTNAIAFVTAGTEDMRITATGDVGIGTNNPATYAGYTSLTINGTDSDIDLNRGGTRQLGIYTTSTLSAINNVANLPLVFYTNNTERMRIDTSGNLTMANGTITNTTALNTDVGLTIIKTSSTVTAGTNKYVQFLTNAGAASTGFIASNGASNAGFFAGSDRRIKTDIQAVSDGVEKIMQLKPSKFKFKENNEQSHGFIAQELNEVFPECVYKPNDGVGEELAEGQEPWAVNLDKLTPYLVAAIQELKAIVDTQAVEIAALKAK